MPIPYNTLSVSPEITLYHTGPDLDLGPLPSFFYFSLSGRDSLCLDPYNQPVRCLHGKRVRVFSMTLPGHGDQFPPTEAVRWWAEEIREGREALSPFIADIEKAVTFAIDSGFIDPQKLAVGGLSRGAFIAAHAAAHDRRFRFLLGFAPLTKLHLAKEFIDLQDHPFVRSWALENLADKLSDRAVRLYIGNCDTRVDTRSCFDFAMALVEKRKTTISPVEFIMSPSTGHMGHGTSPETFKAGAEWIQKILSL